MRVILKYLGYLLLISAVLRLIPLIVALIYGESIKLHLISFTITLVVGIVCSLVQPEKDEFTITKAFILTALCFLVSSLIGSIAFLPLFKWNFHNAFFESVSGFTTTGLSMISDLSIVPKSVLFWRAQTQWIGGIGIVVVFLFLISVMTSRKSLKDTKMHVQSIGRLYHATASVNSPDGTPREVIKSTLWIYLFYTFLGIGFLYITGLPLFEAITICFAALSTGGFSVTNVFYTNAWQLLVISIIMILGATSFVFHHKVFRLKLKNIFQKSQMKLFSYILILFFVISMFFSDKYKEIIFELISALTTAGFSITDTNLLPQVVVLLVVLGMFIGGSTGSTAGGFKLYRVGLLLKSIAWKLKKLTSPPNAVIPLKIQGEAVEIEELTLAGIFFFMYILFALMGILIFMFLGYDFFHSVYQIISSLCTVGLSSMSLIGVPLIGKYTMIVMMFLGRLEVFPIVIIVYKLFSR
ncbi:TrkH family potassium uptake protein [Candidatus Woesearchaeota archaeon]|jgi:trk system potassium uptake protein|nr:TrkH family potassium uptake protein [Candidatus Woesearchaeota archaeon]MBT6519338.1 TrkH family potassium uptake protein [Candidatus Woesearchaeota archaeon]MBT7366798.1 TrkH family potassium uptake protein [Candidatus Woesearchaeota archaeon]